MTKKNKPFFIFDRNDFINEDLRDDLPSYMQDQVKGTWGEEYLDLDSSEKAVEIPDQRVKLSWGDINAEKEEILLSLSGSITENLLDELLDDIEKLRATIGYYHTNVYIDNEMVVDDMDILTEFTNAVVELKRDKMYNSPESAEDHLEYIIKLLYGNMMRSIDFSKTKFSEQSGTLRFDTYENRETNFPKNLKKLKKFCQQLLDGKKDLNVEEHNEDIVRQQADLIIRVVDSLLESIGSGALKSIIKNVVKQVDEIRSGNIYPELLISSKAEDFMRMSISPFYASCMNLYDGSHKKQLLSNVFDKNSKILYVIINKKFEDCRGNKHPYTPIIRSVIRKLDDEQYALDAIYKPNTLEISIDDLIRMMNNKLDTAWFNEDILGGTYEVEYDVDSEAIYTLPATYSDRFTVTGAGSLLERIADLDEDEAIKVIEDQTGYKPEEIDGDFVIFHKMSLDDTVQSLNPNPIRNLYYFFKKEETKTDEVLPILGRYLTHNGEMADELYQYLNDVMSSEMLEFRKDLGERIDPQKHLIEFIKVNSSDGNIRELERKIKRHIHDVENYNNTKEIITRYISYLVQYGDIREMGAEVRIHREKDDILLLEGVTPDSVAMLEGEMSDSAIIQLYENNFVNESEIENMDIDQNMRRGITDYLRQHTFNLNLIERLHNIAEEGLDSDESLDSDEFFNEIEEVINDYLK